jgi:hypothetical protein
MPQPASISDTTKLLFIYGPFALLAIFLLIEERVMYSRLKDAQNGPNARLMRTLYAGVWAIIVALGAFSCYEWAVNRPARVIHGQFENLQPADAVFAHNTEVWFKKQAVTATRFDYLWMAEAQPVHTTQQLSFLLDRTQSGIGEKVLGLEFEVLPEYFADPVRITYDGTTNKFSVRCAATTKTYQAIDSSAAVVGLPTTTAGRGLAVVALTPLMSTGGRSVAPGPFEAAIMAQRLDAGDPTVRRSARQDLAVTGTIAIPWIEQVLSHPSSSYRLRLGTIVALNGMRPEIRGSLSSAAREQIILAALQPDKTLSEAAQRFLITTPSWDEDRDISTVLDKTTDPKALAVLARLDMEVLYNLGISEKDRYGTMKKDDASVFARSVKAFSKAWQRHESASPSETILFAKALYGWGLVLHDRSWIERGAGQKRNPQLVRQAQDMFRRFLDVLGPEGVERYPYPEHVRQARAYIERPEPESLQDRNLPRASAALPDSPALGSTRTKCTEGELLATQGIPAISERCANRIPHAKAQ